MKFLLISLLTFSTFTAFAESNNQTGRLLGATCNTQYGIGQVEIAVYNQETNSLITNRLNVVSDSLCSAGSGWGTGKPIKLVDMAFSSMLGGDTDKLHSFKINSHNVVTDIEEVVVGNDENKKIYDQFSLLNLYNYEVVDFRSVDLDFGLRSQEVIEKITELLKTNEVD